MTHVCTSEGRLATDSSLSLLIPKHQALLYMYV